MHPLLALVILALLIVVISKLFWVGMALLAVWLAWEAFTRSDTYKKYDK